MRKEIITSYENMRGFSGYNLNEDDYYEYDRTGNRLNYEKKYFAKRSCLTMRAMYAYITEQKADSDLIRIIDSICDEFTWVLPGHKADNPHIDLYSATTAHMLCEIAHYIQIPNELHKKIHDIVKVRIKDTYENNAMVWESYKNNWLPVCAGRIGMVYLYEFPEEFPKVKERILGSMSRYIDGFGNDGVCVEGMGYWNFGFGNYLYFAEMLKRVEGTDILQNEKIKEIAKFQQYMFVKNNKTASFSDSSRRDISFDIGKTHFLRKSFGDEIKVPPYKYRNTIGGHCDWAGAFRAFYWFDPTISSDDSYFMEDSGEKYFDDAKWYINRKKKFALVAKGGNNEELHNHNDLGSFIITDGVHQLIADFGAGEYTKDYFITDRRYAFFCCSSAGHSVPIIDGKYQLCGNKYKADVIKANGNNFCLEMSGAYEINDLKGLKRCFDISEDSVVLCDKFKFASGTHDVVERFISMVEPEKDGKYVKIGGMVIKTDCEANISQTDITSHQGEKVTLYIIDYKLKVSDFKAEFAFE